MSQEYLRVHGDERPNDFRMSESDGRVGLWWSLERQYVEDLHP
jgi:hypothetical protein